MSKRFPDLYYEQYVLGELPDPLARQLEQSEDFESRISELKKSNEEILAAYPASTFAKRIVNEHESAQAAPTRPRKSRGTRWFTLALPAAAAMALTFFLATNLDTPNQGTVVDPSTEQVRLKGAAPSLRVFRSEGVNGSLVALENGARARAGDAIQIAYDSASMPYGTVFSIDGRGNVTLHYPLDPSAAPALETGGVVTLPRSFVLDDAPRFERFYFVTADEPFDVSRVINDARRQAQTLIADERTNLDLGEPYQISQFTVEKER